jgi:lysophospholipase L1-like esterase
VLGAGLAAAFGSWVALELLGNESVSASRSPSAGGRISVIGDSLTEGTLRYQADAFAAVGWNQSTIDAHNSRGVRTKVKADPHTGLTAVDAVRESSGEPDVWVIALGTNDAGIFSKDKHADLIREMLDHIGSGHSVMWVNIYLPDARKRQVAWNSALAEVASERPDELIVFDWASLAQNQRWMANDLVHCTGKGYQHRATAIAQASRSIVPIEAPSPPRLLQPWLKALVG